MRFNRSAPHARVVPVLTVSDVRAAVAIHRQPRARIEERLGHEELPSSLDHRNPPGVGAAWIGDAHLSFSATVRSATVSAWSPRAWGLSTAAASGVGVLSEMSALQSRPAIQVAPVVFVTQTVIPVVLAPLLLGESFSATPLGGVPLGASLALLVAAAALLARSPLLVGLTGGYQVSAESGSTPSPSEDSQETIRTSPDTDVEDPSTSTTITSPARIVR